MSCVATPALPASTPPAAPLYQQVAGHYRQAISTGALVPGDRMPSVRALMGLHTVSLSTALQACRELEAAGLLEARPRSGRSEEHTSELQSH